MLRAHVGGGAEYHPDLRSVPREGRRLRKLRGGAGGRITFERFREPVVEHLHGAIFFDLHVRGFQVAVDDASLVARFERLRRLHIANQPLEFA